MRKIRTLASVLALLAVGACADSVSGPSGPEAGGRPRFEGGGLMGSGGLAPDSTNSGSTGTGGTSTSGTTSGGTTEPCTGGTEPCSGTERGGGLMGSGG